MSKNRSLDGFVFLGLGLLFSSVSSVLQRYGGSGSAVSIAQGALDGMSVVSFGASILAIIGGISLRRRVKGLDALSGGAEDVRS